MFEVGVCVDPSSVLDERPNLANIAFSELFVGCCVDQPEATGEGPDYATAFLSELCFRARCPLAPTPYRVAATEAQS